MRRILSLLLILFTPTVWALGSLFESPPTDESLTMLGHIFGVVGDMQLGLGEGTGMFGAMFRVFNGIVIVLGAIVLSYTLIVSVMNTAQEGELMGRKWSSVWIPLRSVLGISLLVPTQSGYSFIQTIVMWIVIQGAGAANEMWSTVLDYWVEHGATPTVETTADTYVIGLDLFKSNVFQSYVCMHAINDLVPGANIRPYVSINASNPTTKLLRFGNPGNANYAYICGEISFEANPDEQMRDTKLSGVAALGNWVDDVAFEIATVSASTLIPPKAAGWDKGAKLAYANRLADYLTRANPLQTDWVEPAKQRGWALTGMYFFYIAQSAEAQLNQHARSMPTFTILPISEFMSVLEPDMAQKVVEKQSRASNWLSTSSATTAEIADGFPTFDDNVGGGPGAFERIWRKSVGQLGMVLLEAIITGIHGGDSPEEILKSNPLLNIRTFATETLITVELIWIATTVLISVITIGLGSIPCFSYSVAISAIIGWIGPLLAGVIALVWAAMASWAYYLPMVPYIVFTMGVVGWIISVLEALVAAPLVAIGLISPSQDELGRVGNAILMIVNIFLRPTLMIFGFVGSVYLMRVAIYLLNLTFLETFKVSGGTMTLFSIMAVITIYTGLMTTLIHKSFSLIYHIPDKVMRWIGHSAEGMGEGQAEQEVRRGAQEGGQKAAGATKAGALGAASGSAGQAKKGAAAGVGGGANITGK